MNTAAALAPEYVPGHVPERVRELQARIRELQTTRLSERSLPTHPAIARLLPGGALQQGAVYSIDRSTTLLMTLLAEPSKAGSWAAVVGMPEFGIEAAAGFGIDLERLALVPHPGEAWLSVAAAITDVMDIVVLRPPKRAREGDISRLTARLRRRGTTLLVLGPWPHSEAMLTLEHSDWIGISNGHGHLAARHATVTVTSRTLPRPRSARLWLPDTRYRVHEAAEHLNVTRLQHSNMRSILEG